MFLKLSHCTHYKLKFTLRLLTLVTVIENLTLQNTFAKVRCVPYANRFSYSSISRSADLLIPSRHLIVLFEHEDEWCWKSSVAGIFRVTLIFSMETWLFFLLGQSLTDVMFWWDTLTSKIIIHININSFDWIWIEKSYNSKEKVTGVQESLILTYEFIIFRVSSSDDYILFLGVRLMEEQGKADSGTSIQGNDEYEKRRGRRGENTENSK